MSTVKLLRLFVAAAFAAISGCAVAQLMDRTRMADMPLAATHADIAFTLTTGLRQRASCDGSATCMAQAGSVAATRFALQVQRISERLQIGAQHLYPDLGTRVPGLINARFDVYVVDGDDPGSASSADGRIALNAALGARQPYDDWMAFVIAREMGHVIARHQEENSATGIATSVIMNILIPGSGLLKTLLSAAGSGIAAKSKRDVQAVEADVIALRLLQAAGFRLRDIYLTLLLDPVVLDEGSWSRNFRGSSDRLVAEVRRREDSAIAVYSGAASAPNRVVGIKLNGIIAPPINRGNMRGIAAAASDVDADGASSGLVQGLRPDRMAPDHMAFR